MSLAAVALLVSGCSTTPGRVLLTPLTGTRDVVDAPLVALTNVFEFWADRSNPIPTPTAGVGVGTGGFGAGLGLNLSYYLFKPLSWLFGGVDYVIGRSLWPNWPRGISPWAGEEGWSALWFPSTRALWSDDGNPPAEAPADSP